MTKVEQFIYDTIGVSLEDKTPFENISTDKTELIKLVTEAKKLAETEQLEACKTFISSIICTKDNQLSAIKLKPTEELQKLYQNIGFDNIISE